MMRSASNRPGLYMIGTLATSIGLQGCSPSTHPSPVPTAISRVTQSQRRATSSAVSLGQVPIQQPRGAESERTMSRPYRTACTEGHRLKGSALWA